MGLAFSNLEPGVENIVLAKNFLAPTTQEFQLRIDSYLSRVWPVSVPFTDGTKTGRTYTITSPQGLSAKVDVCWDSTDTVFVLIRVRSAVNSEAGLFHRIATKMFGNVTGYNIWVNQCQLVMWPYEYWYSGVNYQGVLASVPFVPEYLLAGNNVPCDDYYYKNKISELWVSNGANNQNNFLYKSYMYFDWSVGVNGLSRTEPEVQDGLAASGTRNGSLRIPIVVAPGKERLGGGRNIRYYDFSMPVIAEGLLRGLRYPPYFTFSEVNSDTELLSQQQWLELPGYAHGLMWDSFIEGRYRDKDAVEKLDVGLEGGGTEKRDFVCVSFPPDLTGGFFDDGVGYSLWLLKPRTDVINYAL